MSIDPSSARLVLQALSDAGCAFVWRGNFPISVGEAVRALADPESITADCYGMSKEDLAIHDAHDWTCRALTKKGRRCSLSVAAIGWEKPGGQPLLIESGNPRFFYCDRHIKS